jgi:ATP-dependent exoDNAse (exonuclease V) alpha subunit
MPELQSAESGSDFYFVGRETLEEIAATLVRLIQDRIPNHLGIDPIRDIQVLCPMKSGSIGVRELNTVLQIALNPVRPGEPLLSGSDGASRPVTRSFKPRTTTRRKCLMGTLVPSRRSIRRT